VFENHHWNLKSNPSDMNRNTTWVSPVGAIDSLDAAMNTDRTSNLQPFGTWDDDTRCTGWSSIHQGGAHALMADGASRFISENIDRIGVQKAIATSGAGETVGEF
jgi:prepilin-type processing-associated H-X9-DG protein